MNKKFSFQEQVAIAKQVEDKLYNYWEGLSSTVHLIDLRDKKKWEDYDIDFIHARFQDDIVKFRTVEVKVDFRMSDTGNFFIEIGERGWLNKSKAETIAYLNHGKGLMYYIPNKRLKGYIEAHKSEFDSRKVSTSDWGGYDVEGLLVPYDDVVTNIPIYIEDLTSIL